jgi:type I restriction enzyme, S subunit
MSELPNGWALASLVDVAGVVRGVTYDKRQAASERRPGFLPILRATNINEALDLNSEMVFVPEDCVKPAQRMVQGDIVVASSSGSASVVGKSAQLRTEWEGGFGAFCSVIRPSRGMNPQYLGYFVAGPRVRKAWRVLAQGTNINNLKTSDLAGTLVPIPPYPEQERIVAAIEEQFSRLDAGVAALERVRRNLKRLRAAVLRIATLGMLVPQDPGDLPAENWLTASGKPVAGSMPSGPKFPAGWATTTIGALKTWSLYGPRFSSDDYVAEGTPVLRTTDITDTGHILVGRAPKLGLTNNELEKYRVHIGDVLITRTGSIGTVAYISDDQPAIPGAYLILYRFGLPVQFSEFLFYFLQSPHVQSQLLGKSAGIGRPNLNAPSIDRTVVGVPPWAELLRIVGELRTYLDVIDRLDDVLRGASGHVANSRSSILTAAFSGKLAPQDRSDEPASALLERIAAERAASNGHKTTRAQTSRSTRRKVPA